MSLEDLGNIGEFVGAIAVVLSLIYLAVQIRQNTRSVRASTYQDVVRCDQEIDLVLAADPELNRIWSVGRRDPNRLDENERRRFRMLLVLFYRNFENLYYQRQNKLIDERIWRAWAAYSLRVSSQPGVLRFWESYHDMMSEEFQRFVERGRVTQQPTGVGFHPSGCDSPPPGGA